MAGGMSHPGGSERRETLAERVANTRARQSAEVAGRPATQSGHSTADFHGKRPASWAMPPCNPVTPTSPPPPLRHCWYDGGTYGPQPALLLRWRQVDGHWEGLIVVVAPDETGTAWAVVEMWVSSRMLTAARH